MGLRLLTKRARIGLLTEHASYPGTLESLVAKGEVALRAAAETLVRTGEAVDLGVVKLAARRARKDYLRRAELRRPRLRSEHEVARLSDAVRPLSLEPDRAQ
jgi:hypothetical protein